MYVESREMVLMNLFAGQNRNADVETNLGAHWGKERVEQIERVALNTAFAVFRIDDWGK